MPMTPEEINALNVWLAGAHECLRFDLLTLTTRTGSVLRWCNADVTLTLPDGRSFAPAAYERDRLKGNADLQVDEMQLTLYVDTLDTVGGVPMLHFARRGGLDGAMVSLEWVFFDPQLNLRGYVTRFEGQTGPAETGLGTVTISVRSLISRLMRMVPAEVYQPGCRNTIYDDVCGLDPSAHSVAGVVTAVEAGRLGYFASNLSAPAGAYDLGAVRFTSGALAGEQRTVRAYGGGAVATVLPWPVLPAVGDAFVIRPGCNGTKARCAELANLGRFRGEPHIPAPETAA